MSVLSLIIHQWGKKHQQKGILGGGSFRHSQPLYKLKRSRMEERLTCKKQLILLYPHFPSTLARIIYKAINVKLEKN